MSDGTRRQDGPAAQRRPLGGIRVAFLVANEGVDRAELVEPWGALTAAGGTPVLVAPEAGAVRLMDHLDKGPEWEADVTTRDLRLEDFDAAVLPGGVVNADELRTDASAIEWLRGAFDSGLPVAAICHSLWSLVEADVLVDRTVTSWPSLRTDIENAGGNWVDKSVQLCPNGPNMLVTSRCPDDLDAFCAALVRVFRVEGRSASTRG